MLDVDGQVVSADDFVRRIEQLLGDIRMAGVAAEQVGVSEAATLDAPIHAMRAVHGQMHPPDLARSQGFKGRFGALVKRFVRRLTSWYVEPRWQQQQEIDAQAIQFASMAFNTLHRIDAELDDLRRQNARLRLQTVGLRELVNRYRRAADELQENVDRHEKFLQGVAMHDDLLPLAQEVSSLLDRLGAVGTTGANIDYAGFEDLFRGDSSDVTKAQARYLSLFPSPSDEGIVVDIGCGRGEMLSLLAQEGHEVIGVDTDQGMVDLCKSKGLPAVVDDGIHFLAQTSEGSLKGVFCAQVVEHLITPELEQFIRLAFRALQVGGVLVVETINPRSSFALGEHFYADTSHVRPVHPETLRFILQQVGFRNVQLEERSPHPAVALADELPEDTVGEAVAVLLRSVFGYQDYVIVATK